MLCGFQAERRVTQLPAKIGRGFHRFAVSTVPKKIASLSRQHTTRPPPPPLPSRCRTGSTVSPRSGTTRFPRSPWAAVVRPTGAAGTPKALPQSKMDCGFWIWWMPTRRMAVRSLRTRARTAASMTSQAWCSAFPVKSGSVTPKETACPRRVLCTTWCGAGATKVRVGQAFPNVTHRPFYLQRRCLWRTEAGDCCPHGVQYTYRLPRL